MWGAIKVALVAGNIILLSLLGASVWKLRQDFSGHWHYSFREVSLPDLRTESFFSRFPVSVYAVKPGTSRRHSSPAMGQDCCVAY